MKYVHGAVPLLVSPLLSGFREIGHAVTTRIGGVSEGTFWSLNLAPRAGDTPDNVRENRKRACTAANASYERLTSLKQVLGAKAVVIKEKQAGREAPRVEGDALMTNLPGTPLITFSADCGLVLLFDPVKRAVASVHASRAGTRLGVIQNSIDGMVKAYKSTPGDLVAFIGPSIGQCCHEIRTPDAEDWEAFVPGSTSGRNLDLKLAIRRLLETAGVVHIEATDLCTKCRPDWFHSHRRDGAGAGRFGAMIWLK